MLLSGKQCVCVCGLNSNLSFFKNSEINGMLANANNAILDASSLDIQTLTSLCLSLSLSRPETCRVGL